MAGLMLLLALALVVLRTQPAPPRLIADKADSTQTTAALTAQPSATATPTASATASATAPPPPTRADLGIVTPAVPPASATPTVHIVQPGESLGAIASTYGVPVDDLIAANEIEDPNVVFVGQVLVVPLGGTIIPAETALAVAPTHTPTPFTLTPTITPTPSPTPPPPATLNGVLLSSFIVMPSAVQENILAIYAHGQELGNEPGAFSKIGDSTIENPHFLARFDDGIYNLGEYVYLQPVIDYYSGSHGRQGITVQRGLHTWSVFDPAWADPDLCEPNETPIACEFRLHRPSVVLIRLGANDPGVPDLFTENLQRIVTYSMESGVIPVLGTKPDRREGPELDYNAIIRETAAQFNVPLWDYALLAQTLPDRGLGSDNIHMTFFWAHDYRQDRALRQGHGLHNLSALMALDEVWHVIAPDVAPPRPTATPTPTPSDTPTHTPSATATPSATPSATASPTATAPPPDTLPPSSEDTAQAG